MPVAKIHVLEGRYDEARLSRVSNAVQHGLINALGIPPHETPGENISFGRGLAQRAHLSDREKVAS
jgi:hypothetical protein